MGGNFIIDLYIRGLNVCLNDFKIFFSPSPLTEFNEHDSAACNNILNKKSLTYDLISVGLF